MGHCIEPKKNEWAGGRLAGKMPRFCAAGHNQIAQFN
jgi:hypothetical protein